MVTKTNAVEAAAPTAEKQVLSSTYRSDVGLAANTTYGVPALPQGDAEAPQVIPEDIRLSSPPPTAKDLRTPNQNLVDLENKDPSMVEAFTQGLFPTGKDWWSSYKDSRRFERDALFPTNKYAEEWFKENGQESAWENQYLNGAVRYEDFEYRKQRILEKRAELEIAAARPYTTMAAGIFDIDIVTAALPPVYGAAKATTGAKLVARSLQAATGASIAVATNSALAPYSTRTEDERDMDAYVFGLVGFLTDVNKAQKAIGSPTNAVTAQPSTPVPPQIKITPIRTGVITETKVPNLKNWQYTPKVDVVDTYPTPKDVPAITVDKSPDKPSVFISVADKAYLEYYTKTSRKDDVILPENTYQVVSVGVSPDMRGQGIAKAMYKQAIADAVADNKRFISDKSVSEEALQVYKALEKDGYVFKYNITDDTAKETVEWDRGVSTTQYINYDGTPLVELVSAPTTSTSKVNTTTGVGVKQQYQVPSTQSTTVLNPKGYGVLSQQQVLPTHVAQSLQQATAQVLAGLKPVSKPTGTPSEWFRKYPMLSRMTSSADELWLYTNGDQSTVVNKLLSNVHTEGDNVASAQASYLNNYGYALAGVEKALSDAVPAITGVGSNPLTRLSGKYGQAASEIMDLFQDSMQKLDQAVVDYAGKHNGAVPNDDAIKQMIDSMDVHEAMKHAMKTYVDSGFATRIYDDAKANGFFEANGMDEILRRPTYMPLQHNYDRMHSLVRDGKATWDDIYDFYGAQITRIYPELLQPNFAKAGRTYQQVLKGAATATTAPFKLTLRQVGEHFVQTQREAARGLSDVTTHGMGKETMHDMLTRAGLTSDEAASAVKTIFEEQASRQSQPKNLRKRMSWDWNYKMVASTGEELDLGKLTGGSAYGNLEAYSRRMAHLNGLAQYGLTQQSLQELLESYIDKAPKGVNPQQVRKFMANISDDLAGRPTGGDVSQAIRSMQAIADPMLLANSGLFGLVDLATQAVRTGLIRTFPHIYRGLRAAFKGMDGMSKANAQDLEDIFTGKLMQGSRWKNFMTHYSDNFSIEGGGVHEAAQYYGQSARFMNLSEAVKRLQIGILMGVYLRAIRGAAAGEAKHVGFLADKLRMPDELIQGIKEQWAKHGEKIDDWDAEVRIPMEQKIFHESDNLAFTVHKGETPAILEYDGVGKVVLPYMRFAFAMQQKVLRRVWNRDGAAGVAILLAAQFPIAMMVAASINVRKGEEPDKDLALGTLRAVTAIGILGYPIELLINGVGANGVTAMTPFSKTYNLIGDAIQGDITPRSIKENTILNSAVFLDPLILPTED